jgi:hypothetical protein
MKRIIRAAVGRGHYHGPTNAIRYDIIEPLFEQLMSIYHSRDFPKALRTMAFEHALKLRPVGGGSIGNTFENDLMKLVFTATAIANIADNAASSPITNIEYSLHTADPGEAGDQTTSETTYTSYARVPVLRNGTGHTVTNNSVSPAANIDFPAGTGGSGTVTHFAAGTAHTSTGKILFSGTVTPNIVTGNGITPRLTTASTITVD